MNEEMKKMVKELFKLSGMVYREDEGICQIAFENIDDLFNKIVDKMYQSRLLGAKDAIEAVKIELREKYNQVEYKKDRYGYLMAMNDTKFKAQQFIDSLEEKLQ